MDFKITEWTKEENQLLINKVKRMGIEKISTIMNKTNYDVIMHIHELPNDIKFFKCQDYTWNKDEDLYLIDNYKKSINEIKKYLNKNIKSIKKRLRLLNLKKGRQPCKNKLTYTERWVMSMLKRLKIPFEFQKRIDYTKYNKKRYYIVDFAINDTIIEVQGTYWHGDPRVYNKNKLNSIQINNIKKDKIKKQVLESLGYKLIYIWELDLHINNRYIFNMLKAIKN